MLYMIYCGPKCHVPHACIYEVSPKSLVILYPSGISCKNWNALWFEEEFVIECSPPPESSEGRKIRFGGSQSGIGLYARNASTFSALPAG